MKKSDLHYEFPAELVATERKPVSRVMLVDGEAPVEVTTSYILTQMAPQDVLVINNTQVIPARVHSEQGLEILFVSEREDDVWEVLCQARRWPKGEKQTLPGGVTLELLEKGRPQLVRSSRKLDPTYFDDHGEMPLPPYIQQARGERHSRESDLEMYQTDWAQEIGSLAAPTASLHFSKTDLDKVKSRGAQVVPLSLHVGLGTFLPIRAENLSEHQMHHEMVVIPKETWRVVKEAQSTGGKVWALGSTVTRALESQALGMLTETDDHFVGESDLFIRPGFEYQVVDWMLTNFHQPESTLIAMVMAFAGKEQVENSYKWAIEHRFRLFSYGDLSVWKKSVNLS